LVTANLAVWAVRGSLKNMKRAIIAFVSFFWELALTEPPHLCSFH